jgi:multicomponent Na+:H+ antiporter subunit D
MPVLVPLPVVVPLGVAGLLLVCAHVLPRRAPDVVALLTALGVCGICLVLAGQAGAGPLVYWFGGWVPVHGVPLGIGFVVDQVGAGMGVFIALLFAATLVFAWGYFDAVHAHFQILMLLFMAGMIGFCFTHDLFNMFVWFEVMSVAGFALTGYQLRSSALEGALNFTVVNTIGAYLILAGIGLMYARIGALDFSALGVGVAKAPGDVVVLAAFVLLMTGLLIKAAQVPFQFWLADAHAVAPSPVSVIFSGAMVAIGIFGIARLYWAVFAGDAEIAALVRGLLLWMGVASALVGGLMTIVQRHLKRMLAFSTISHVGVLLIGFALLNAQGLAGMFLYLVGHGLVKGAMFMVAGILLAELASIDEVGLRGLGGPVWPAGVAMGLGGLLLAGLPLGWMAAGADMIAAAGKTWFVPAVVTVSAAFTGGAVLRAAARIFLGWGAVPGDEERAPTEEEREKADRPLWLMLLPAVVLLMLGVFGGDAAAGFVGRAVAVFMRPDNAALLGLAGARGVAAVNVAAPGGTGAAWLGGGLAVLIAGFNLLRRDLPEVVTKGVDVVLRPVFGSLQALHSGLIGDYVAWLVVGVAMFVVAVVIVG